MSIGCGKNLMLTSIFLLGPLLQWETAFHGAFAESSSRAAPQSYMIWSVLGEQQMLSPVGSHGSPWRECLLHFLAICGLFLPRDIDASHSPLLRIYWGYFIPLLPSAFLVQFLPRGVCAEEMGEGCQVDTMYSFLHGFQWKAPRN